REDRVVGDAEAAQDLHAAVDDPPDRLRADDLRHARLVPAPLTLVEDPGGVPNDEPALVDVHLVVGEHEADTLMLADRFAERGAPTGITHGNVMGAPCGAEPAHAMRQARRRQADLRIAKALTDPPQYLALVHPQSVEADDRMTTGHVLIERVQYPFDMDPRRV